LGIGVTYNPLQKGIDLTYDPLQWSIGFTNAPKILVLISSQ
jgi:hypothetical protein